MQGLIDSTLREGMQTVGVDLSLKRRVELAAALVEIGIEEIELGPVRAGDMMSWPAWLQAADARPQPDDWPSGAAAGPMISTMPSP